MATSNHRVTRRGPRRQHPPKADRPFTPEFKAKNDGKTETHLPLEPRRDLVGNFLDVIRGKGNLCCNAELGAATMVAIKLAVESYRQKKTMLWDAKTERVTAT